MACARVPLDEQSVTEPGPLGKERTLPALVSHSAVLYTPNSPNMYTDWFNVIKDSAFCLLAPGEERGALFCALQASTRRWISRWGGGVSGTCQIHYRGPRVAACLAPWQVLVSGEGRLTYDHFTEMHFLYLFYISLQMLAEWKIQCTSSD